MPSLAELAVALGVAFAVVDVAQEIPHPQPARVTEAPQQQVDAQVRMRGGANQVGQFAFLQAQMPEQHLAIVGVTEAVGPAVLDRPATAPDLGHRRATGLRQRDVDLAGVLRCAQVGAEVNPRQYIVIERLVRVRLVGQLIGTAVAR